MAPLGELQPSCGRLPRLDFSQLADEVGFTSLSSRTKVGSVLPPRQPGQLSRAVSLGDNHHHHGAQQWAPVRRVVSARGTAAAKPSPRLAQAGNLGSFAKYCSHAGAGQPGGAGAQIFVAGVCVDGASEHSKGRATSAAALAGPGVGEVGLMDLEVRSMRQAALLGAGAAAAQRPASSGAVATSVTSRPLCTPRPASSGCTPATGSCASGTPGERWQPAFRRVEKSPAPATAGVVATYDSPLRCRGSCVMGRRPAAAWAPAVGGCGSAAASNASEMEALTSSSALSKAGDSSGRSSSGASISGAAAFTGSAVKAAIEEDLEAAAESEPEGLTPMRHCSASPSREKRRARARSSSQLSNSALEVEESYMDDCSTDESKDEEEEDEKSDDLAPDSEPEGGSSKLQSPRSSCRQRACSKEASESGRALLQSASTPPASLHRAPKGCRRPRGACPRGSPVAASVADAECCEDEATRMAEPGCCTNCLGGELAAEESAVARRLLGRRSGALASSTTPPPQRRTVVAFEEPVVTPCSSQRGGDDKSDGESTLRMDDSGGLVRSRRILFSPAADDRASLSTADAETPQRTPTPTHFVGVMSPASSGSLSPSSRVAPTSLLLCTPEARIARASSKARPRASSVGSFDSDGPVGRRRRVSWASPLRTTIVITPVLSERKRGLAVEPLSDLDVLQAALVDEDEEMELEVDSDEDADDEAPLDAETPEKRDLASSLSPKAFCEDKENDPNLFNRCLLMKPRQSKAAAIVAELKKEQADDGTLGALGHHTVRRNGRGGMAGLVAKLDSAATEDSDVSQACTLRRLSVGGC
eukprot:TRINITY_DN16828_c0_g1_i1.p1 TRINITY_DN16828_c0_g1~~TRINITY_DN16828_c0_g1_i1.p1  ORF type:complete len:860 (-),score=174.28 TRINITY_DN16828_c0_g1_i1:435-2888(-)